MAFFGVALFFDLAVLVDFTVVFDFGPTRQRFLPSAASMRPFASAVPHDGTTAWKAAS